MFDYGLESRAHLLLLCKFLRPHTIEDYSTSTKWYKVLGELPKYTIDNFINNGLLGPGNLRDHISYKYRVPELKILLRQLELLLSGRKDELISRIILADPEGMEKNVQDIDVFICTEKGTVIAEQYLREQEIIRDETEWRVFIFLQENRFGQACSEVTKFEANQVFQRGINVDWNNFDCDDWGKILSNISSRTPQVLHDIQSRIIESHRILAGMKYLWGKINIQKWVDKIIPNDIEIQFHIIRSLIAYADFLSSIETLKEHGYKHVKITSYVNDQLVCDECNILNKKIFEIDNVPELPRTDCTSDHGCRCMIQPVFDSLNPR